MNISYYLKDGFKVFSPFLFVGSLAYIHSQKKYYMPTLSDRSINYIDIRNELRQVLQTQSTNEKLNIGPLLIRLAFNQSGTYSKQDGTGGSNGSTMRFLQEASDPQNKGLDQAIDFLEPVKKRYPGISYADLWVLASYVAIEVMGGPRIEFVPGRQDYTQEKYCPPNGRIPNEEKDKVSIKESFYRMGLQDREIVALVGGSNCLGKQIKEIQKNEKEILFTNDYFKLLLDENWNEKQQGENKYFYNNDGKVIILPGELELRNDLSFRKYAILYKEDQFQFHYDFAQAYKKLTELGFRVF